MQQNKPTRKHIAIVLANGMRNELHPLTMNFPFTNLPVGNKKLIVYQLEQLQSIAQLDLVIVVYSEDSVKVRQFLEGEFLECHREYPHAIEFFQVENSMSEYASLQKVLSASIYDGFEEAKSVFVVPRNVISSIKFNTLFSEHVEKESDVTMLLKQKKEYGKDEKKPDFDYEPQIDIAMVSDKGEIFALRSIQNYEYSGFSLPASVYQRVSRASFQKVIDMGVYIFNSRVIKIVKNLHNNEICNLKSDFMDTLIRNQNNSTFLDLAGERESKPLKVVAKVAGQNEYVRSIVNIPIYESVNLDSLIRGPKQKQAIMPTVYTQPIDQKYMAEFRGSLIGKGCEIEPGNKLTRSVIENGCKIGKNVDMSNSIIMTGTVIEDGCKIVGSIIGPNCLIKAQSIVSFCQLAMKCVVENSSNIENQMIIPAK